MSPSRPSQSSAATSSQAHDRLSDELLKPWDGRLAFASTSEKRNSDEYLFDDEEGIDEDEIRILERVEIQYLQSQRSSCPATTEERDNTSTLLIDQIIDLTLSPSPKRSASKRDSGMITPTRPRAVARYVSAESRTAMSPLRYVPQPFASQFAPSQPVHPFFKAGGKHQMNQVRASSSQTPPPAALPPRMSMRAIFPGGSQSTESASGSQETTTSTGTTASGSTSGTESPISSRTGYAINRMQTVGEISGQRADYHSGRFPQAHFNRGKSVEKVPDDLVLDFDSLTIDPSTVWLGKQLSGPVKSPAPEAHPPPKEQTPSVSKAPVNAEFFAQPNLPTFSHKTYTPPPNSTGTYVPPSIVYTSCPDEADDLITLLKGDVIGFDMEWPFGYRFDHKEKRSKMKEGKTALVQICDDKIVLLLHLSKMKRIPKGLEELCAADDIYKLGVNIKNDGIKLARDYPSVKPRAMLDLSYLARAVDPTNCGEKHMLISLAKLTRGYLHHDLDKGEVRTSKWDAELNEKQKDYAANDVYSSILIYKHLMEMAAKRKTTVDRHALCQPRPPPEVPPNGKKPYFWKHHRKSSGSTSSSR